MLIVDGRKIKSWNELSWFERKWFWYITWNFPILIYKVKQFIIRPFCKHKFVEEQTDKNRMYYWISCRICGKHLMPKITMEEHENSKLDTSYVGLYITEEEIEQQKEDLDKLLSRNW